METFSLTSKRLGFLDCLFGINLSPIFNLVSLFSKKGNAAYSFADTHPTQSDSQKSCSSMELYQKFVLQGCDSSGNHTKGFKACR